MRVLKKELYEKNRIQHLLNKEKEFSKQYFFSLFSHYQNDENFVNTIWKKITKISLTNAYIQEKNQQFYENEKIENLMNAYFYLKV